MSLQNSMGFLANTPSYVLYSIDGSSLIRNTTTMTAFNISIINLNTMVSNISVYATTGGGDGPFVMLQTAIFTLDRPPKVQNVLVEVLTLTAVRISWDRLDIPEITQYLVYYTHRAKRKRKEESIVQVPATASSAIINNLTSDRQYLFAVQAQAILDGTLVVGPRSEQNIVVFTCSGESKGETDMAVIIAVPVAVITTIILYSIILVVGVTCYCWKSGKNKDKHPNIDMKECEAYGRVSVEGSAQHYESVIH